MIIHQSQKPIGYKEFVGWDMWLDFQRAEGPRKVLICKLSGKMWKGRPRKRWLEAVQEDLKIYKVVNWEQKTIDKKKYITISYKALGLQGM